jgi:hypothetical protein
MVDRELSRAVEAYLLRLWPYERREGVITLGDDTARRLLPRLKELADEAFHWPVDWQQNDEASASRTVEDGIAAAHPELDRDAVRALRAHFDLCHK